MAKISFIDQNYFERLLQMESGYVLDFSNNTFQRFIYNSTEIDIYEKYEYASKANLLRRIIADFDSVTVGKLLVELLEYKRSHLNINDNEKEVFLKCVEIANRLMGRVVNNNQSQGNLQNNNQPNVSFNFTDSLNALIKLSTINDSQQRGFAFEKYLFNFLAQNDLDPRGSFKIIGEQIDGSFLLHNEIYLLEAKWTKKLIDKGELVTFNEKVSSKSSFTRGLFISFSGYTGQALESLASGRTIHITLMTVQELAVILERKIDFKQALNKKVRALAEEGSFYKNIMELI
ncbi:MAG: hypothetical protein FH756_13975 [Firmicutes bacterium]|nr:hypothetical protein [Bacillota bacterium]